MVQLHQEKYDQSTELERKERRERGRRGEDHDVTMCCAPVDTWVST